MVQGITSAYVTKFSIEVLSGLLQKIPMNLASTLVDVASEARPAPTTERVRAGKMLEAVLLMLAAIFFSLHFVHLKADFPNHSPWMDWAKYTDEGWYGDAAIRHYQLGHWNVPGDFNPAAALPVWPALELMLFRLSGVSLVAARALTVSVFGLILVCCYVLIARSCSGAAESRRRSLAPSIAVLLLSVNPFCFVFSRLAILEPLLILLVLAALLAARSAGDASAQARYAEVDGEGEGEGKRLNRQVLIRAGALGLLLPLIVLTKTTGVFLFPAICWLLWASTAYCLKPFLRAAGVACGVGIVAWSVYYLVFVRPRYLIDYRYLFSANAYTGITLATFWTVLRDALLAGSWIGGALFTLALAAVVSSVVKLFRQRMCGNPMVVALLLWIFGYGAFLTYHANLQPRYYLVLAIPLTMLTAMEFDAVLAGGLAESGGHARRRVFRLTAVVSGAALVFAAVSGAWRTISYVRHPEYTWVSAANQISDAVQREAAAHPDHSRLVMSISGSDLALMTGLPSICDDFGTMTLPERVAKYRPGWFATWNDVEDDKMEALAPWFRLVRVATIPAFDDPDRNVLILYRLDPLNSPGRPGRPGRRRFLSVPKRLRTKVGEQPSPVQLKH